MTTNPEVTMTEGRRLPRLLTGLALALWLIAAVVGTVGDSLKTLEREASFSFQGEPVGTCSEINPAAVERDSAVATQWCTPSSVLGPSLPSGVETYVGDIDWSNVGASDFVEALGQPELWLTLGVGGSALFIFAAFARATGTVRAGLAAAVSIVFLGLLLFPSAFTSRIAPDMRIELVSAWKWVIVFYFGSEAAVQAWKIANPNSPAAGDLAPHQAQDGHGK
jgi:hypothetical protein